MGGFFNPDSSFSRIMNRIFDLFVLNILWVICSIPIVTIGAATSALFECNLNLVNGDESSLITNFFKAFKSKFKRSTFLWLFILAISSVLGFNLIFWLKSGMSISYIALPIIFFSILVVLLITPYVFPILMKSQLSLKNMLKYCFFVSIGYLPNSILITTINILFFLGALTIPTITVLMLLIGFAINNYLICTVINKVFIKINLNPNTRNLLNL